MPQGKNKLRRRLYRLAFFSLATWGFLALGRGRGAEPEPVRFRPADDAADSVPGWASTPAPSTARRRTPTRRLAASFAFAVLFFAGASFSAVAGDAVVNALEGDPEAAAVAEETTTEEAAPEPAPVAEPAPEAAPAPEPAPAVEPAPVAEPAPAPESSFVADETPEAAAPAPAAEPAPEAVPAAEPAPEAPAPAPAEAPAQAEQAEPVAADDPVRKAKQTSDHELELAQARERAPRSVPAVAPAAAPLPKRPAPHSHGLDPEVGTPGTSATVWLNRTAPDPTPAALRLSPEFASKLVREARRAKVDWALVLGVLRAEGARGRVPVRQPTLAEAARRLASLDASDDAWGAALEYTGRTAGADRAVALARYYRAVGLKALVRGLLAQEDALVERVLHDPRVDVYAGGRADLEAGRIDVRVVALIAYLAEAHGQVTVSSLFSGHRMYARPGVVSAHMYGAAIDIAALGGVPIYGHQEPGSVTEKAVRDILLLPTEMRPRQVISLIGMGGPSFPMADHADHVHVGY